MQTRCFFGRLEIEFRTKKEREIQNGTIKKDMVLPANSLFFEDLFQYKNLL